MVQACRFSRVIFYHLCFLRISRNNPGHNLVGLQNGEMMLLGGYDEVEDSDLDAVWKLNSATGWTRIGSLQQVIIQLRSL